MIETKIIYQDVSPDAKMTATYTGTNVESYSDYADKFNNALNETSTYATLEKNMWRLDGNKKLFPSDPTDSQYTWGFVSSTISGSDGVFAVGEEPTMTVDYSSAQESVGITIDFDTILSEYPTSVEIQYYLNDELLDDTIYECSTPQFCFVKEVSGYNKVVMKFLSTSIPYRRIRMINIYYGIIRTFGHEELESVSATEELNPISSELSINTMDFSVRNTSEIPFLFQKMQPIQLQYGNTMIGNYYIDESTRTAKNKYEISCIDNIGVLDKSTFLGGLYSNKNAVELIDEIMSNTRIDYTIDDAFNSKTVSGYIPICTRREALLYVCFSIGAVADTSRSSKILINALTDIVKESYADETTYASGSVTTSSKVTSVVVKAYNYAQDSTQEASELLKETLTVGDHTITFETPCYGYSVIGATIKASDVNYVVVTVDTEQEVILSGYNYVETAIEYEKKNPVIKLTDVQNTVTSDSCRLVNRNNVNEVLDRVYDYCMRNETVSTKLAIGNNVSVGDVVEIPTIYNEVVKCRLTRIKLSFGNTKMAGEVDGLVIDN